MHLTTRRAPPSPLNSRPTSLSETCSLISSGSTIDIIPPSPNALSNISKSNVRRSFHQDHISENNMSYAIYQNHFQVLSKPSTLLNEQTNTLRRSSSPSKVAQQTNIGSEKFNCSKTAQSTYNYSNSSLNEIGRPSSLFLCSEPSNSQKGISNTPNVFVRSHENENSSSTCIRRPSFTNLSNFQRRSKLRMNFNRWVGLFIFYFILFRNQK